MEVIIDTNFIISCLRKKIDFVSQLEEQGFKVLIPKEVMQELKDVRRNSRASREDRIAIDAALEMFSGKKVKHITLGGGKVDDWMIHKGKQGYYIATLDREIKKHIPNRVVIFDAQKKVGAE